MHIRKPRIKTVEALGYRHIRLVLDLLVVLVANRDNDAKKIKLLTRGPLLMQLGRKKILC